MLEGGAVDAGMRSARSAGGVWQNPVPARALALRRRTAPAQRSAWNWPAKRAWCRQREEDYPAETGQPHYLPDERTCVLPVHLGPGKTYSLWLNTEQYHGFQDRNGIAAVPYLLSFRTAETPQVVLNGITNVDGSKRPLLETPSTASSDTEPLQLLDPGAEPRKMLRLHPIPGNKQTTVMTVKLSSHQNRRSGNSINHAPAGEAEHGFNRQERRGQWRYQLGDGHRRRQHRRSGGRFVGK